MTATMSIDQVVVGSAAIARPTNADASTYIGRSEPVPLVDTIVLPEKYGGRVQKVEVLLNPR